jgi:hypothetical protein
MQTPTDTETVFAEIAADLAALATIESMSVEEIDAALAALEVTP